MNESLWIQECPLSNFPSLKNDIEVNTLIIGAGIAGLTTAYYLSKAHQSIAIIEADHVGYGASGRSTGKITSQHGFIYHDLIAEYGYEKAKLYYSANEEAIDSIEEIVNEYQIDCDFKRVSSVLFAFDEMKKAKLQDEYQACLDLDIPCTYIDKTNYPFSIIGGIRFDKQAQFQPLKYLQGLARILVDQGISIYEQTTADQLYDVSNGYRITCKNKHTIHAKQVVIATQFPFIDRGHFYFSRMYSDASFLSAAPCSLPLGDDQLISIDDDSRSYRTYQNKLIAGGGVHKSGQFDKLKYDDFILHNKSMFQLGDDDITWSSQDYMSFDHIPYIGCMEKGNPNLLIASGFNKWGNTSGTIAGKLLCAYLLENESQYQDLYDPHRFKGIFSAQFIKENMNVAYEFIRGKLKNANQSFPNPGQGCIMEIDHHKYGVYQSETKEIFIVDATCPHLGCLLHFNDMDKTWDCPCHGSRFHVDGRVVKGPANDKLRLYGEGLNDIDAHIFKP